ncbi:MAG: FtsX-like permease family protein [Flavobacteriales bacterium]|nr:FtsX-like permease family protein [Flavobacteriales bacterium]
MNMLRLSWANLRADRLSTVLSIMLLAIGVGMVSFVMVAGAQMLDRFNRDIRGIDMVVGAKGSPLQLILSAVYQMDSPTGNIPLSEAQKLQKHPLVKYSIPLAYGDSYQGYRIVGSEVRYLEHYGAQFAAGEGWTDDFEAVLGSVVAENLGLRLGDHFHGSHGLVDDMQVHEEAAYHVVGILNPTGTVLDRLILTNIGSVWHIHGEHADAAEEAQAEHGHADEEHAHQAAEDDREITALLVKFKSPMGMMQLPRHINANTSMQAALPAIEINRLYELLGVGFTTLQIIGMLIMAIAAISVFISLLNSLKDRKYELALMRSLGASPAKLFGMVIMESLLLCAIGYAAGIALGRAALLLMSYLSEQQMQFQLSGGWFSAEELCLLPITLLIGLFAALIPAFQAYRTDISEILRNE